MTSEFVAVVVDTLLPGDALDLPLPSGSAAGVVSELGDELRSDRHRAVLQAIATAAGGEAEFLRASVTTREAAVRHVEVQMRDSFGALVLLALSEYYQADAVLLAMGWRAEPPQPSGHALEPLDEALLEPVRKRGRLWRS